MLFLGGTFNLKQFKGCGYSEGVFLFEEWEVLFGRGEVRRRRLLRISPSSTEQSRSYTEFFW